MRISDAKVLYATRITNLEEDVFEGRIQDVTSHRIFTSKEKHLDVKPSDLRERWQIGLGAPNKTLKATIQRILRLAIIPISRGYRSNHMFERPHIKGTIFTYTTTERYKYLDSNRYAQVFPNDYFLSASYPIYKKSLSMQGQRAFITDFGVMGRLVFLWIERPDCKGDEFHERSTGARDRTTCHQSILPQPIQG